MIMGRADSLASLVRSVQPQHLYDPDPEGSGGDGGGGGSSAQLAPDPEKMVVEALTRQGPSPVPALAAATGLGLSKLLDALDRLQKYGLIAVVDEPNSGRVVRLAP